MIDIPIPKETDHIFTSIEAATSRLESLPNNLGINLQKLCKQYGSAFVIKDFILCFFRLLFPDGKPCRTNTYWFHAICYEKIARHIGTEFDILVAEFDLTDYVIAVETSLNKYIDSQLKLDDDFLKMYSRILDGFQTLSDVLQITNEPKYKSVVAVIKELKGSISDDLLPGRSKIFSTKKNKNKNKVKNNQPINQPNLEDKQLNNQIKKQPLPQSSTIKTNVTDELISDWTPVLEINSSPNQSEIINHINLDNNINQSDRSNYPNRPNRFNQPDRPDRFNQFDRPNYSNQPNRFNQLDKSDRFNQSDRPTYSNQPNRFNQSDRPNYLNRPNQFDQPAGIDSPGRSNSYPYSVNNPPSLKIPITHTLNISPILGQIVHAVIITLIDILPVECEIGNICVFCISIISIIYPISL